MSSKRSINSRTFISVPSEVNVQHAIRKRCINATALGKTVIRPLAFKLILKPCPNLETRFLLDTPVVRSDDFEYELV
jgi:hypothetical protein